MAKVKVRSIQEVIDEYLALYKAPSYYKWDEGRHGSLVDAAKKLDAAVFANSTIKLTVSKIIPSRKIMILIPKDVSKRWICNAIFDILGDIKGINFGKTGIWIELVDVPWSQ